MAQQMLLDGLHGNNFVCCIDFNRRNPVPDVSLYCKTFRHLCVGCTVLRCFERIADRAVYYDAWCKSGGDTDFAFRLRYTCTICGFAVVYLGSQYANTIL